MSTDTSEGKPLSWAQACARLRFRHLQFIDILGRSRNLRLAAEQMHLTQPAATKMLMDIEALLQARLFDRLPRGVRPNELGLFTLRYAQVALAGQRQFVDEFNALKQGGHGQLAIGAITGSAAPLLMAAVAEVQRLRPLLVLKLLEHSSDQLVQWLAERRIDLMIGRFTDDAQRERFHCEPLAGEQLEVVAGVNHPLRGDAELSLATLVQWPWVLYPPPTAVRKVADELFSASGLALRSGVVETPSFLFALELLQATDMLSLQPAALVDKYVAKGLLARLPVTLPDRLPDYGLITRLDEPPTPAAQAFMAVLRAKAGVAGGPADDTPAGA